MKFLGVILLPLAPLGRGRGEGITVTVPEGPVADPLYLFGATAS